MGYGIGGYGGYGPGFYGGYGAAGYGGYGGGWGIRWLFALLVLIVIVLQFGRNQRPCSNNTNDICCSDGVVNSDECRTVGANFNNGLIDNSVLFIIVIFLLAICGGCFAWGGYGGGYGC